MPLPQVVGFTVLSFAILIILFAFFYVTIQYNPVEIANNLRQNNGSIPVFVRVNQRLTILQKFFLRLPLSVHCS